MKLSVFDSKKSEDVIKLFSKVFTASEGEAEGALIGGLVSNLITITDEKDLVGFIASSGDNIVGSLFFSRLVIPSHKVAFILSPVAIATSHQGKGIGQQLISFGIEHLKSLGVDLVLTYGDPNFYAKVGFEQISEGLIKAPFKLSQPEGWLAQSLNDVPIEAMDGSAQCVKALDDPQYW